MKHLKILSALTVAGFLSSSAFAEPVVIESELKLIGFSGGSCTVNVNANANATSLDLDNINFDVNVGEVAVSCDYPHRIVASYDVDNSFGDIVLTSQDGVDQLPISVRVDGSYINNLTGEYDLGSTPPGLDSVMPIMIDTPVLAAAPGIYQGSVTFSVIVD